MDKKEIQHILMGLCFFVLFGCSPGNKSNERNLWTDTKVTTLLDESIRFNLPNNFKRSSRYRIKDDLPFLKQDTLQLKVLQNILEGLEYEDSEVDVFIDTTTEFRILIICNIERIQFGKGDLAQLKTQINKDNRREEDRTLFMRYGPVKATINNNGKLQMGKLHYSQTFTLENSTNYFSTYYVSSNSYSVIAHEISDNEQSIENYLWSFAAD